MYGQLIYNKGARNIQWVRTVYSINGAGKIEQSHEEEGNWTAVLHHTQKLTQIRLNT